MNRRQFLKNVGFGFAGIAVCGSDSNAKKVFTNKVTKINLETRKAKEPNLLIFHCDELTFRMLGCYRQILPEDQTMLWGPEAKIETPNIDWIASNGAICKHCYASSPICSPSRSSFMSGRYPQNSPVIDNRVKLGADTVTFAKILLDRGYATGYCGKWHLDGPPDPGWYPRDKFGFIDNRYMWNCGHGKNLAFNDPTAKFISGVGDETSFPSDFLANRAIEFIKAHASEQFCYMVAFPDPHSPDNVRAPYKTMYDNLNYQMPSTYVVREVPSWARPTSAPATQTIYFGMLKCIDDNIGRVLQTVRDANLIDKTIIVFTADHGDLRGEYHRQDKCVPMDGSAQIPLMIYYPGKIPAGTIVKETISCIDFLPTILSLMEIPTAGKEEGRDASQMFLTGQAAGWKDIAFSRGRTQPVADQGDSNLWVAAVTMKYKLILSEVETDSPWLIDLQINPIDEVAHNYFNDPDYAQVRSYLASEMLAYGDKYNDPRVKMAKIQQELHAAL